MNRHTSPAVALSLLLLCQAPANAQREMLFGPEEATEPIKLTSRQSISGAAMRVTAKPTSSTTTPPTTMHSSMQVAEPQPDGTIGITLPALPPLPGATVSGSSRPAPDKERGSILGPASVKSVETVSASRPRPEQYLDSPAVRLAPPDVAPQPPVMQATQATQRAVEPKAPDEPHSRVKAPIPILSDKPPAVRVNPFTHRRRLATRLPSGPLIAISPGLSKGTGGNYAHDQSYLPLANYLSEQIGRLLIPVYETDLASLRSAILGRRYPIIHASNLVFDDLRKSGYKQIVMNEPGVGLAIVVRSGSSIKEPKHLSRHSVAVDLAGPISRFATAALAGEGIDDNVRLIDAEGPTLEHVLDRVLEGSVDAGIINTMQAEQAQRKAPGMLRVLKTYPVGETDGVWVLPDRPDFQFVARLARALEGLATDKVHQDVANRLSFATQLPVRFRTLGQ